MHEVAEDAIRSTILKPETNMRDPYIYLLRTTAQRELRALLAADRNMRDAQHKLLEVVEPKAAAVA
jgi:hypothetical protein